MQVLRGQGTSTQNQAVIANAGMALYCASEQLSMADALSTARESLESGKALGCFNKLIEN
jgi:anthranilate phosphoribosyltransferase